jgi:transcriptional antiterminator RfaH
MREALTRITKEPFYFDSKYKVMDNSLIVSEATIGDTIRWYVAHTHPKQEDRACSNLRVLGVPTFNPKIRERRYNQFVNAPAYIIKPLFPRYIFARFEINSLYHKVRFTRGIYNVVSFGEEPVPINQEIIALIQSNINEDGFVRLVEEIHPGDRVIVKDGPLKHFAGVFEREMKNTERIRILLETVGYQAHIEIDRDMVKKAC